MAKTKKPAFSQGASGSIGDLVFDKRGYVRSKPKKSSKPQSPARGNVQQSFGAARKAVKVAGPAIERAVRTNEYIKRKKGYEQKYFQGGYWATYLASAMPGPDRGWFIKYGNAFANLPPDAQELWEKVAYVIGLEHFQLPHASEAPISAGLQLYWLASMLPSLGICLTLEAPNANNALFWAATITEIDIDTIAEAVNNLQNCPQPPIKHAQASTHQITASKAEERHSHPLQPDPLGPALLEQLNSSAQDNFLPPTNTFYGSNQFASGNHLPNHLPQFLLPVEWNNNHLPPYPITIHEPITQPTQPTSPPTNPPIPPTRTTKHPPVTTYQPLALEWSELVKQLTAFVLTILLPSILRQERLSSYAPYSTLVDVLPTVKKQGFCKIKEGVVSRLAKFRYAPLWTLFVSFSLKEVFFPLGWSVKKQTDR